LTDQNYTVVRKYYGRQDHARALYRADALVMANYGYFPISESWAEGEYGLKGRERRPT
jgi:hypothetical protein